MKKMYIFFIVIVQLAVFTFSLAFVTNSWALDPCSLYTRDDAESLFGEKVADVKEKKGMLPAGNICRYSFVVNGETYGIEVKISETFEIKKEGINNSASDVFARQKKARLSNKYAAKKYKEIKGTGDEAFFSGNNLWARKGEYLLIITVNPASKGSYKNMAEAEKAGYEQRMSLAKKAADAIMARIK